MKVEKVFLRTEHNYDRDAASDESGLQCLDESKTIQSARDETDINEIVRRFGLTGKLPDNIRLPQYGDFTGISDYHAAVNAVAQARESFDKLPATLRARFHNEPEEFIDFAADPKNREELKTLGLLSKEAVQKDLEDAARARGIDPQTGEVLVLKDKPGQKDTIPPKPTEKGVT